MAMLGIKYDRNVWKKTFVAKIQEYVNDDVENETMKYLGAVWTERQRNERNRVNVIP